MTRLNGKKLKQVIDPTVAKAFTHPLRGHVWVTLFERGVVSPTEIAKELALEVTEVSYHFRELHRKKLIRLARTVQRRGFDEHFYEPVRPALDFDDSEWMKLPAGIRARLSGETVKQVIDSLTGALGAGSFDARSRHLSRTWVQVDERGWKELMRTMQRTVERVQAIQQRSAERCGKSSETPVPVEVVLAGFETAASAAGREAGEAEAL
jgi:predicted ArsR family transcriptional regulator